MILQFLAYGNYENYWNKPGSLGEGKTEEAYTHTNSPFRTLIQKQKRKDTRGVHGLSISFRSLLTCKTEKCKRQNSRWDTIAIAMKKQSSACYHGPHCLQFLKTTQMFLALFTMDFCVVPCACSSSFTSVRKELFLTHKQGMGEKCAP